MTRTRALPQLISLAVLAVSALLFSPNAEAMMGSRSEATSSKKESGKSAGLVLALYRPTPKTERLVDMIAWGLSQGADSSVQVLGEKPDLSTLRPDGTLYLAVHGEVGRFTGRKRGAKEGDPGAVIQIEPVLAALTNPKSGLPADFKGKIEILACNAGDKAVANDLVPTLNAALVEQELPNNLATWITAAFGKNGGFSANTLSTIRTYLNKKKPFSQSETANAARVDDIIEYLKSVSANLNGPLNHSLVEKVAFGLRSTGRRGITVTGAVGKVTAFRGQNQQIVFTSLTAEQIAAMEYVISLCTGFYLGQGGGNDPNAQAANAWLLSETNIAKHGSLSHLEEYLTKTVYNPPNDLGQHAREFAESTEELERLLHECFQNIDFTQYCGQRSPIRPTKGSFQSVVS